MREILFPFSILSICENFIKLTALRIIDVIDLVKYIEKLLILIFKKGLYYKNIKYRQQMKIILRFCISRQ